MLKKVADSIEECGRCEHLYFPGEEIFYSISFGFVCAECHSRKGRQMATSLSGCVN